MAKVGEGDPRWIVAARDDGTNVNQWHWTESDYSGWATNRLKQLVNDQVLESDIFTSKLSELTLEGEVSVNTRKQKTFLFYELNMTVKWQGTHLPSSTQGKGLVRVPYISEENADDEFEVQVNMEDEKSKEATILKDEFRKKLIPFLKEKIPMMLKELRETCISKTKLAVKEQPSAKVLDKVAPIVFKMPTVEEKKTSGPSLTNFSFTEKFLCTPRDVFDSLLITGRVRAYAGSDSFAGLEKGDKFKLFGGSVEGENLEIIPQKKIVQKWRFASWPSDLYSIVTIDLEEKNGKTIVKLEQKGLPQEDLERTEAGWKENFFRRMKGVFGWGTL